jgi:hypothetical protein
MTPYTPPEKKVRLYKFRTIENKEWTNHILKKEELWCSPLWDQNDPMEGVYSYLTENENSIDFSAIFSEKNKYKICSLSSRHALRNPTIWGYYTNGFRGIAIEIELNVSDLSEATKSGKVVKVNYENEPRHWNILSNLNIDQAARTIITTKLNKWKSESEYRFLTQKDGYNKIGKITGIYFGNPHQNTGNKDQILKHSSSLSKYLEEREGYLKICHRLGYDCYYSHISRSGRTWQVEHIPVPSPYQKPPRQSKPN